MPDLPPVPFPDVSKDKRALAGHIIVTALIKESASLNRLQIQRPTQRVKDRVRALGDIIASVKLALPASHLTTCQLTLRDDNEQQHHARLVNLMLISASKLVHLSAVVLDHTRSFSSNVWQQLLDVCQDVVSIVKAFGPQPFTHVDPALCLIVSAVLSYQHLYGKCCHLDQPDIEGKLEGSNRILVLFLERFAAHWYFPRFILGMYCGPTSRPAYVTLMPVTPSISRAVLQGYPRDVDF